MSKKIPQTGDVFPPSLYDSTVEKCRKLIHVLQDIRTGLFI
ncbi:MAG: hypothetical protein NTW29_03405 [Bacteroidetes bacterium]|nr:hypothetical protein [Bacteroidota bacterium]